MYVLYFTPSQWQLNTISITVSVLKRRKLKLRDVSCSQAAKWKTDYVKTQIDLVPGLPTYGSQRIRRHCDKGAQQ